ncbi:Lrp/AsnC family transcriptional regulator [Candidatus Thorarchaeota archaeon]|nr:MAG: Lrp/AsnC family transcriptional regulator [Candidatus Thorarchaeota archaeon]
MSEEISEIDKAILSAILEDSHRPSAITSIVNGRGVNCTQNEVVKALNELEDKGLVERYTSKTWLAKPSAADYID